MNFFRLTTVLLTAVASRPAATREDASFIDFYRSAPDRNPRTVMSLADAAREARLLSWTVRPF